MIVVKWARRSSACGGDDLAELNKKHSREVWIDVAKGLGIIAVVLGHTDHPVVKYIYWFHMPLFFALSGYLFKPVEDSAMIGTWIRKRTSQLLIPYASFMIVLLAAWYLQHPPVSAVKVGHDLLGIASGGRSIPREFIGLYAPFWFITCLYATQILFMLITHKWKSTIVRIAVVLAAYVLAHACAYLYSTHRFAVPWNLDVALIALSFYGFGFFGKPLLSGRYHPWAISISALLLPTAFVCADRMKLMDYQLDLKYLGYHNLLLDLLIPLTTVVLACAVAHLLAASRASRLLPLLGTASLPIMYLHMYTNEFLNQYVRYGIVGFVLIGLLVPLAIWGFVLQRFPITRRLFLGAK